MILRKIRYLNLMKKFNLMFLRIFFFDESQEGILKSSSKKKVFFNKILLRITFITSLQNCIQIESFIILLPTSRPLCQFFPAFFFFVFFFYFSKWNSKSWNCCKQSRRFWSVYVFAWSKNVFSDSGGFEFWLPLFILYSQTFPTIICIIYFK